MKIYQSLDIYIYTYITIYTVQLNCQNYHKYFVSCIMTVSTAVMAEMNEVFYKNFYQTVKK